MLASVEGRRSPWLVLGKLQVSASTHLLHAPLGHSAMRPLLGSAVHGEP
jgi:hypothetical protein